MPCLIRNHPERRLLAIKKKLVSMGRSADNDIVIDDASVLPYHAQILFDGRDFNVAALEEKAQLALNGKPKKKFRLMHQDHMDVGAVSLTFSMLDGAAQTDASASGQEWNTDLMAADGVRRLQEFSQKLMTESSLQDLLETLLDTVIDTTRAEKGFLVLIQEAQQNHVVVARGVRGQPLPPSVNALSDTVLKKVIETGRPLLVSDAHSDQEFRASESILSLRVSSVMCAPLLSRGKMLGVLYVGTHDARSGFDQRGLEIYSIFAAQAALILENAMLLEELRTDRDRLQTRVAMKEFGSILGACAPMLDVFRAIEKVAATEVSVLISGETGTGKELVAHEIHRRSDRANGPFIVINCGAIPENLMESELFGHVRGAFTGALQTREGKFQAARGGTLFLDEIGEMPTNLQVKLLRAIQERTVTKVGSHIAEKVDIRVLAATHRDLLVEQQAGRFREDLYYRLNVVNIKLPALRERGDDVILLAKYLLDRHAKELGSPVKGFTADAIAAMRKYAWPGNIRQLDNRIKKAVVLADHPMIDAGDLEMNPETVAVTKTLAEAREDFQRRYVLEVLERNHGNRTHAARDLGVDPRTIFRYLEREVDVPTESQRRRQGDSGEAD